MEKTELIIQSFVLQEPVTALTDFIITTLCVLFYIKLGSSDFNRLNELWRKFFINVGVSALLGGIAHLLHFYLEGPIHKIIWLSMNVLSAVAVYFAELSAIEVVIPEQKKKFYNKLAIYLLLSFTLLSLYTQNFNIAKINMAIGLIFISISHFLTHKKGLNGSIYVASGMLISFIPVAIHSLKISINKWFNFNDISHVFMMLSLYLIFLGVAAFDLYEENIENIEETELSSESIGSVDYNPNK